MHPKLKKIEELLDEYAVEGNSCFIGRNDWVVTLYGDFIHSAWRKGTIEELGKDIRDNASLYFGIAKTTKENPPDFYYGFQDQGLNIYWHQV